jgi:hypothetical protein
MARIIDIATKEVTITVEQRTVSFMVETPKGKPPLVTVRRERLEIDQDGKILTQGEHRIITRTYAQLLADPEAAAIVAAIPAILDRWEVEDEAAGL